MTAGTVAATLIVVVVSPVAGWLLASVLHHRFWLWRGHSHAWHLNPGGRGCDLP